MDDAKRERLSPAPAGESMARIKNRLVEIHLGTFDFLCANTVMAADLRDLLGDRLIPLQTLDADILAAIKADRFRLNMAQWHSRSRCGTTHCRAGAAIALHPIGEELERVFGSWLAGAAIYLAAREGTSREGQIPNFFANYVEAMEDIQQCADEGGF